MTSAPGQIFMTGIVVLTNPRAINPSRGNRNIAFDVNFPVEDGSHDQSLALLRYFTPENRISDLDKVWQDRFTKAFVITKVCIHFAIPFYTNHVIFSSDSFYA